MSSRRAPDDYRTRLWLDEDLTEPAPSALDLAYERATEAERSRHEDRVSALIRARAATLRPISDNRTDLVETVAKDVPAALARLFQILEEFAGKPGKVAQSEADRWAHEASVLIIQLKNAKSISFDEPGLAPETRLALLRANLPERERTLAKRLRLTVSDEE